MPKPEKEPKPPVVGAVVGVGVLPNPTTGLLIPKPKPLVVGVFVEDDVVEGGPPPKIPEA